MSALMVNKNLPHQITTALDDVLAFTSHELRNQLMVLSMSSLKLSYLMEDTADSQQQIAIQRIQQSTLALKRTASTFLHLAQMNDPTFHPKVILVNPLDDIIKPLMFLYADFLAENNLDCQIDITPEGKLIWADPELLSSILENLLTNAIKYGKPGGTIIIKISERSNEDEILVWNSGEGIPLDELDSVFERYSRGTNSVGKIGSGIGLYLAKKMTIAHGGRVWADSKPGKWASFTLMFPSRGR